MKVKKIMLKIREMDDRGDFIQEILLQLQGHSFIMFIPRLLPAGTLIDTLRY